jgi:hypothetical protein
MHEFGKKEPAVNVIEYPFEYFDAQIQFAQKWSELNNVLFVEALAKNTSLFKRIPDVAALSKIVRTFGIPDLSSTIYNLYLQQSQSPYNSPVYPENDEKHFGFFGHDYYPNNVLNRGKNTIKVHFINKHRGPKSGLHVDFALQRKLDVKRMFEFIKVAYPEAEEVIGGSWLYSLPAYRDSYPPLFTVNMRRLVPPGFEKEFPDAIPNMTFTGDSIWGQFVDRYGWGRRSVYEQFLENVQSATQPKDLIEAFPNKPIQPIAPIEVFYEWQP